MKLFVFSFFALWFLLPFNIAAQLNDCEDAEVVCDDGDISFNPQGPGDDDFADPDNIPGCITSLEQNSAWYYFQIDPNAPPNLVLGFIIQPKGGLGEDYDWALFGPNVTCGTLGAPIRCSSASAACGFCPETGMGMGTTDITEGPGTGDGFVSTLIVQPGQSFYLLIDNWQGTMNGFILTWTDTAADWLDCTATPPCALEAIAGTDINRCEGDLSPFSLNGQSSGSDGNETYSWSGTNGGTAYLSNPNIENPEVNLPAGFTGSITYTLTVVEDTCTGVDQMELIVHPLPVIIINQIGPFCRNNPPQTLSATPPGGTWSGANTGSSFNPATNGPGTHTVTYRYTNANNCTSTESIDIVVYDIPAVDIEPIPTEFCESEGSILLTATGTGGAGGFSYAWNTPSGPGSGSTYNATSPGQHIISVTDANGCTNTSATTVIVHPTPEVEIDEPGALCQELEFFNLIANPPGGIFSGAIISPNGEINPNLNAPGTYSITYTYTDAFGCVGSDVEGITIVGTPNAFAENNGPLCAGLPILLFGQTDISGSNVTYHWEGPGGYISNVQNPTNATQGGIYTLQVTIDGCVSEEVVTEVVITDMPNVVATNSGPYCNGQSIQLLGSTSSIGNDIVYAWTGPNGYTSNLQNPANATAPGTYSLIITVDGCASAVASTVVIFGQPPAAVATNTGPYCSGETVQLLGSTSTNGTAISYTWTGPNGYMSVAQNPTGILQPGTYQLVVNVDGCNSVTQSTEVIINLPPQPSITGQAEFCTGNSTTLDAGIGYASYLWNNASSNQTIEVFSSGTYSVTITDTGGCTGQASVSVTETASLSPVITGDFDFCEGSSTILDAGTGFTSYAWSTGETSQTITVADQGNYGVIVMDAEGCSGSANITTTVNPNPVVVIGGSTTYCIGGFTVLDAGAGHSIYLWSNNSSAQTITVSSPGNYSVGVVDVNGCVGSASVSVIESTSLSPVITGNNAFCENGSTTLNAGSGFANYTWSDGSTSQHLIVNAANTYSVTVSDGQGCSGSSSIAVIEIVPPFAVVQTQAELCNTETGGSVINLFDLILSGDMNGTWQDADNSGAVGLFDNLDFKNIAAGDYRFIYTTNSAIDPCPETMYEVVVTILECTCPDVFFANAPVLCNENDVLDLDDLQNTSEPGIWTLIQTPPGSNPATLNGTVVNATGSDAGQYVFEFNLQNPQPPGCPLDFEVIVVVDEKANAGVAAQPVSYCFNEDDNIDLAGLLTGEDANGTWKETSSVPSQGSAFNSFNGTFNTGSQIAGTYTFEYTVESNSTCPDDASLVTVVINPLPSVSIANFGILDCVNTSQSLNASGSSFGPDYNISWAGPGIIANQNTLNPTIDKPGNYTLTITNTITGCTDAASVTVIQNNEAPSSAIISSQNAPCFGSQNAFITVEQVIGGTAPYQYSLDNVTFSSNNSFTNLPAGNYVLTLVDAGGCKWDTMITIAEPSEITIDLGPDIQLEFGDNALVEALVNLSPNQIDTLIWSPNNILECIDMFCLQGNVNTVNTVTLSATVYDLDGCSVTDDIIIRVNKNRRVYIPNSFSPNDDGINDIFYVFGLDRQISKIKKFLIYNRWGELIHERSDILPNDASSGWDGKFKNELLNPGVFVYRAEIEFVDGLVEVITGDVTLVK